MSTERGHSSNLLLVVCISLCSLSVSSQFVEGSHWPLFLGSVGTPQFRHPVGVKMNCLGWIELLGFVAVGYAV